MGHQPTQEQRKGKGPECGDGMESPVVQQASTPSNPHGCVHGPLAEAGLGPSPLSNTPPPRGPVSTGEGG